MRRKEVEGYLILEVVPKRELTLFDFADLPDRTRFSGAGRSEEIQAALKAYAEQTEGTQATQKRLFAQDAAHGFAFIDLCRKRYDVLVMNPPFGEASKPSKAYIEIATRVPKKMSMRPLSGVGYRFSSLELCLALLPRATGSFSPRSRSGVRRFCCRRSDLPSLPTWATVSWIRPWWKPAVYCLEAVGRGETSGR